MSLSLSISVYNALSNAPLLVLQYLYVLSPSVAAEDYQQLSATLDFPLGDETTQCVNISVIDDDEVQKFQQFSFLDIAMRAESVLITNDAR